MTGDHDRVVTPPAEFWTGRTGARTATLDVPTAAIERDHAWDELVAWFEEFHDWSDLVHQLDGDTH